MLTADRKPVDRSRQAPFERLLADLFRRAGWKIPRRAVIGQHQAGLLVRRGNQAYVVEFKSGPEARRDRLIPLLAQAILQAQAIARESEEPVDPLAVVGSTRVSPRRAEEIRRFATEYAPGVAVGIVDLEGFREFTGPELEDLNSRPEREPFPSPVRRPPAQIFSDLNQWMLKVLLAPHIPENMLSAPRDQYRNASRLAEAAGVSVMSAFRFVDQLLREGFLEESGRVLRLVRVEELMRRWQAASFLRQREFPMRWVIRRDSIGQLLEALRSHQSQSTAARTARSRPVYQSPSPRACLGLFAAADALGIGSVHGVPPHIYLEKADVYATRQLGLSAELAEGSLDVYVRIPAARESVFRGAVLREGVPVCDVIQIWLDVAAHPSRGTFQAERIRSRILAPLLEEKA